MSQKSGNCHHNGSHRSSSSPLRRVVASVFFVKLLNQSRVHVCLCVCVFAPYRMLCLILVLSILRTSIEAPVVFMDVPCRSQALCGFRTSLGCVGIMFDVLRCH